MYPEAHEGWRKLVFGLLWPNTLSLLSYRRTDTSQVTKPSSSGNVRCGYEMARSRIRETADGPVLAEPSRGNVDLWRYSYRDTVCNIHKDFEGEAPMKYDPTMTVDIASEDLQQRKTRISLFVLFRVYKCKKHITGRCWVSRLDRLPPADRSEEQTANEWTTDDLLQITKSMMRWIWPEARKMPGLNACSKLVRLVKTIEMLSEYAQSANISSALSCDRVAPKQ